MFLRSLSLLGFKTFARPTEIRFEGGVTAIVGPNGSGKTNIVDAIKWVLGSGQARDLRGKTMAEVIYVGGERRSRAAFAEVTLVFDNTAGRLPVDYHEVAIKRRVERDGESDYFLNGSRIRRRDLIHMLSSTGLTVDSYAIIGQHDIEEIVVCTPAERRQLLEEAAQVRGVKQRRQEAVHRLTDLAANLLRLEDLKSEIEPRLEVLRVQAGAAREASEATARLELLRGSIVWEEWREARDAHRRASSQVQALDRRLGEAREIAQSAETEFQTWRAEIQAAQDRRLARQRNLGRLRLEVAEAEHSLRLTEERAENTAALAEAARREESDNRSLSAAAEALRGQLTEELEQAMHSLESVPEAPAIPDAPDPAEVQQARRSAEQARRAVAATTSTLAALRTRREFLEEQSTRVESLAQAAEQIPPLEADLDVARREAAETEGAVVMAARLRSELEGLEALRPEPEPGLERLCDVVTAETGYEAALSAVLGPLVDALVARDEAAAAGATPDRQRTVLYPVTSPQPRAGSLLDHVRCQAGYEDVACRLLGHVVVGEDVTLDGVYREPGLLRAGSDPRVAIDVRRHELRDRLAGLQPHAAKADEMAKRVKDAESSLADLRSRAAGAARAEETARMLTMARAAELAESEKMPELERVANAADEHAATLAKELESSFEAIGEGRAAAHHAELDRARWRDRLDDIRRQLAAVGDDLRRMLMAA